MNYYAISSGDLLRCLRHRDAESAAKLALAEALIEGPVDLEDSVFVAELDAREVAEFDTAELGREFGIIKMRDLN